MHRRIQPTTTGPVLQPQDNNPPQRVIKVRRDYNTWVARETLEDYALRFTPRSFRKWSETRVANTAFGAASFLVLEAVGATLLVNYGFINAFWAILATGLIIFLTGLPISVYAARYGVDMDLLTRGAGFGYIGSTITSLIYATFTFIFFALEAAIMAYALELGFGIPPAMGYLICALVVIPLATHGVTAISKLQTLTQPLWLVLLVLPYLFVLTREPAVLSGLWGYGGGFSLALFGAALTVGIALITQMGEQVDYLRFMPEPTPGNRRSWWLNVIIGGPGWVLLGVVKMLGGALLAWLVLRSGVAADKAVDPNRMYLAGFSQVFDHGTVAVAVTVVFVVISQLKINVTNAYAGSLAWSNFFARLTHSHPGRVVWMVFNTLIALMLMELDLFQALGQVLGLYSNVAISWMVAVVADLVINKPLGLSPPGIEFKRAHLYDINPVGVGAMGVASALSIAAFLGVFGTEVKPYASFIALATALAVSPLIAWATQGRYYLARTPEKADAGRSHTCCICEREYEGDDMAHCPAYQGPICSLCCSLDARCNDLCKPQGRLSSQWAALLAQLLPKQVLPLLDTGLGHYLLLMSAVVPGLCLLLGLLYYQELISLRPDQQVLVPHLQQTFVKAFSALLLVSGIAGWWLVLTHKSRQVAQEESNRQTHLLMHEIESHRRTDEALQKAKHSADLANQAKSRYITAISHELRTPLNSILGYAQILDGDPSIPEHRRQAVGVIRKSGDHLLSLIEGTLDIARIEGGKLTLDVQPLAFADFVQQIVDMFALQARKKRLSFHYQPEGELPTVVRTDERRLRQILINILGNAVKFTEAGSVTLRLRYQREMATFEIADTGPGIAAEDVERIFEPFAQGGGEAIAVGGAGIGLTISKMLVDVMGGELAVESVQGQGSLFRIRVFLPQVHGPAALAKPRSAMPVGYSGIRRRILVVDNERVDRELLVNVLAPLGFQMEQAASGLEALQVIPRFLPHLILMDLAMPGIDGWETIHRIRSEGLSDAPIAVISANAFEKGLPDNGRKSGLPAEDFILKPVRIDELLDWIALKLHIQWVSAEGSVPTPPPPAAAYDDTAVPTALARELQNLIDLGYVRGIIGKLAEIEGEHPGLAGFCASLRHLARQFQFEAMNDLLHRAAARNAP
ncbi:MAG: response regulator [Rhodocyclaceae bacterium]|nr:MAG: response regulator [Rhodocyclaceae bacterium]